MQLLQDVPDITDVVALTDWLEILLMASQKSVTRARLKEVLGAAGDIPTGDIEVAIDFVYKEVERRHAIAQSGYPLIISESRIALNKEGNYEFYKFFLLISISKPLRVEKRQNEVDLLFDESVRKAVESYLGKGTQSVRFGWPPSGGRPTNFQDAIGWLCLKMNLPSGIGKQIPTTKDGGIDIVAWKPFRDQKRQFLILYVQCTIQIEWFEKATDIIDLLVLGWIDTGKTFLSALAIPFVIPKNFNKRDALSRTINIVFDRLRLVEFLIDVNSSDLPEVLEWSKKELRTVST